MKTYCAEREHLIATAQPGLSAARRLCELTDTAVRELAESAAPLLGGRWAVCALGGWGAGALLPESDLDLLVLSDAPPAALKPFVEAVLYPLWDSGLKVGHQVRSPKAHLTACREDDLETLTASLTGRVIAGDETYGAQALGAVATNARKRSRHVLRRLAERVRPGSPYLLEPDLKSGAGGRRDYDELVWSSAAVSGRCVADPAALAESGALAAHELGTLLECAEVVAAARWETQLLGSGDRLTLDAASGLRTDPSSVQRALAETALILTRARRRLSGGADPQPASIDAPALFDLLNQGAEALPPLEELAQSSALDTLVPGTRDLMALRRPGLSHTLTVGAHCLAAAASVRGLAHEGALLARSHAEAGDLRIAQAAALVHDVGKIASGPGHADRGSAPALDAALRLGLGQAAAEDVAALVRLHLVLIETATRDDIDDEDAVLRCAARIGRRELIAPLHLLTAADSMATGPTTWSPWIANLTATLVARVDAALAPGADGPGMWERAEAVRTSALDSMGDVADDELEFVRTAPLRYLSSRQPTEVARDAGLVAGLARTRGAEQARIAVSGGPAPETYSVTIAAADKPSLLAHLAGAIALAGLDILSFDAYGTTRHVALDSFVVRSATRRAVTTETLNRLERLVTAALKDRYELATRLAERRRHYPARVSVAPQVEVTPSGWDTTVQVVAADRPGLLHDLASAVSATGLDIRWARARTLEGVAHDTFHVVGPDGGPADDLGSLGHLSMRLREVL